MNKIETANKICNRFSQLIDSTEGKFANIFEFTINKILFYVSPTAISFPVKDKSKYIISFQKIYVPENELIYFLRDDIHNISLYISKKKSEIEKQRFLIQLYDGCEYVFNDMNLFLNDLDIETMKWL